MGFSVDKFKVETDDGRISSLLEEVFYRTADGELIHLPVDTRSDGASIPQVLWNILPPFGRYWMAAFLHDYLYRVLQMPKERCDELLLEAMLGCGVDELTAQVIYCGVHYGGQHSFTQDRIQQLLQARALTLTGTTQITVGQPTQP